MNILFLHGLETGPHGNKYQALKKAFGKIIAPDCSGMNNEKERLDKIQLEIGSSDEPFIVVGSSMGGLMALLLQMEHPEQVAGLVLCAPALQRQPDHIFDFENLPPTIVIHGINDEVVPLEVSRPFGSRLIIVADDHRLSNSIDKIIQAVNTLKQEIYS
ncbi:MAG: alpha/beta fold hydrolase [Desulfuromonadales bacterium]|nr:alpha/beta fold hydrolase [Desulfuromonadales bacterium]